MRRLAGLLEVGKVLVIVLFTAVVIRYFVLQPFQVEGMSMEPNFHSGELILIEKLSYRFHQPYRGDVIVFRYPNQPSVDYIKRIIALPGETIRIQNDNVYIDSILLDEKYLAGGEITTIASSPPTTFETTLGQGQYFVMGDNRTRSSDSREWGPLDQRFIIGRSNIIFYPTNSFKAIASPSYN